MNNLHESRKELCGIYIDMGTTNTRVWLLRGLKILAAASAPVGVSDSARDGSTQKIFATLKKLIADVRQYHAVTNQPIFCIAAGMITSALGLVEIPHLLAPAGKNELAAAIRNHSFPEITDLPFFLVPGVKIDPSNEVETPLQFDLIRGEETLCVGLLETKTLSPGGMFLSLGSHWKFIGTDQNGRIVSSISSLAGELLRCAQTQTILASSVSQEWPPHLEAAWVEKGIAEQNKSGLSRALYCVRLLQQKKMANGEDRFAYLCGAFIGEDLEKLLGKDVFDSSSSFVIVGSTALAEAWRETLQRRSIKATVLSPEEREHNLLTGLHSFATSVINHSPQSAR